MTAFAPRAASHREQPGSDRVARDHRLFARYREGAGVPADRDEVVARFLPLARQLAARYRALPVDHDAVRAAGGLRGYDRGILGTRSLPVHAESA